MKNLQKILKINKINLLFTLAFLLSAFNSQACGPYGNNRFVYSPVKEVTVFLQGAQVHREGQFNIPKGVSEIIFSDVSPYINRNSIQAKGKGNFTILEVRHHIHYPEPANVIQPGFPPHIKKAIALLGDSIQNIGFERSEIAAKKHVLEMERKILLATKMYKGTGKSSDSIPLLKEGMAFFRLKMNDINKRVFALNKEEVKVTELEKGMNERIYQLRLYKKNVTPPKTANPIQQVIVTVSSKQGISGKMGINYMVSNAGWSAHYDLRASNTSSPIELTYKAKVYQQTGENWDNVKLKLSTNNPNKSNVKPSLPIWYLDYYQQRNFSTSNLSNAVNLADVQIMNAKSQRFEKKKELLEEIQKDAGTSSNYTQIAENIAHVEFEIDLRYNIKSNGESHLVEVQKNELPCDFYHIVVPKMDREAFVMAKMTGWENLNLLPATASIFFDGTYIGQTLINPLQLSDTLQVSMGRDASVYVERTKNADDIKPQVIGSNLIKTISYELVLKNKKSTPINLVIEDQIPVTNNPEIKVSLENKGKAKFNNKTGALTWKTNIEQGKEQRFNFSYSIKYDKDKNLLGNL